MAGVTFEISYEGMDRALRAVAELGEVERSELSEGIGALIENSTKRRIANEKTAPDGTPWDGWSEGYAATRRSGQSILVGEGNLRDSIQFFATGDEVEVGSNLIYAATHQAGREEDGIPARPYLGLSARDERDIKDLIEDFVADVVEGAR